MTDRIGFDGSELAYIATSLDKASAVAAAETAKVVAKAANNIKTDAAKRISGLAHAPRYPRSIDYDLYVTGLAHAPRYPRSIDYDLYVTGRGAVADVGANKDKPQGALGNLLEYGSVKNPPHPHIRPAADAEMPRFEQAMDALALKALGL